MANGNADAILNFAIGEEEKAAELYTSLAGKMTRPEMARVFLEFAEEEKGHKAKLLSLREEWHTKAPNGKVADLKIADYAADAAPSENMDYQQALIFAMKREKAAFKLYSDLAGAVEDPRARTMLLNLAQEEARHKLRFEVEYEETFYVEN